LIFSVAPDPDGYWRLPIQSTPPCRQSGQHLIYVSALFAVTKALNGSRA